MHNNGTVLEEWVAKIQEEFSNCGDYFSKISLPDLKFIKVFFMMIQILKSMK